MASFASISYSMICTGNDPRLGKAVGPYGRFVPALLRSRLDDELKDLVRSLPRFAALVTNRRNHETDLLFTHHRCLAPLSHNLPKRAHSLCPKMCPRSPITGLILPQANQPDKEKPLDKSAIYRGVSFNGPALMPVRYQAALRPESRFTGS